MSTISPPRHFLCGAGKRSRTSDLRITNALLYQLSYTGTQELRLYRKRFFCAILLGLCGRLSFRLQRTVEVGRCSTPVNQKVRTGDERTSRIHNELGCGLALFTFQSADRSFVRCRKSRDVYSFLLQKIQRDRRKYPESVRQKPTAHRSKEIDDR